jgi:glycoprotein 6-alpha-L-fucosyltransferase
LVGKKRKKNFFFTQRYSKYKFIFDKSNAESASVTSRYTPDSAQGVIMDIYFLSRCDYLVCTFSSQVCRLAYELMQVRYPDASWRFKSLDDVYYFGGQKEHIIEAVYDHEPPENSDEIELKKGDLISLAGNHWNGFSKGKNKRSGAEGILTKNEFFFKWRNLKKMFFYFKDYFLRIK